MFQSGILKIEIPNFKNFKNFGGFLVIEILKLPTL